MGRGRKREVDMLLNAVPTADLQREREGRRRIAATQSNDNEVNTTNAAAGSPVAGSSSPNAAVAPVVTASPPPSNLRPVRLLRRRRNDNLGDDADDDHEEYFAGLSARSSSSDDSLGGILDDDDADDDATVTEEERKRQKSLEKKAMLPDNILAPLAELRAHLENSPCPNCLGKRDGDHDDHHTALWRQSLKVQHHSWGALTDIVVLCTVCNDERVVSPSITTGNIEQNNEAAAPKRRTRPTNNNKKTGAAAKYNPHDYTRFRRYPINYQMILLTQVLGCGTEGLDIIFAHLGIAPSRGGYNKWKAVQDAVGEVQHIVADEVLQENAQQVTQAYNDEADAVLENFHGTDNEKRVKKNELLHIKDGRVGVAVGMDGAWQKRSIGLNKGNSLSGMNFCVELMTRKIVNCVVYAKKCTQCQRFRKTHGNDEQPPPHRCSQNYNPEDSSKSMEAEASLLHKEDIELREPSTGIYIHTLCTDDDSTTRANTKYNLTAYYNAKYGAGNWRRSDDNVDWPYTLDVKGNKKYMQPSQDKGHLNLQCFPISRYTTDINHRVRVMLKHIFALKSSAKVPPPGKLTLGECHRLKKYAGTFFRKNRKLPFDEFKQRAHCIYLHHFGDHSCCHIDWCKHLQSTRNDGIEQAILTDAYIRSFRHKNNALDEVVFKLVEKAYAPYLTDEHLYQCYHGYDTNKNESLNRKCSATAPKDRYFSGTMSLADRFKYVVIHDSVGYQEGNRRLLLKLGICTELTSPVLEEWSRRLDRVKNNKAEYRQKPEVKRKRSAKIYELLKTIQVGNARAKASGKDYASGAAVAEANTNADDNNTSKNKVADRSHWTLAELAELDVSSSSGTSNSDDSFSDRNSIGGGSQQFGDL